MRPIPFLKMHGLGNDFVIIDARETGFTPSKDFCLQVADRHRGVGFDQLIILNQPRNPKADWFVQFFNADGSTAGACGNGTRCVAYLLFEETKKTNGIIETEAGLLPIWREDDGLYAVDFGLPSLAWDQIPLAIKTNTISVDLDIEGLPPACCVNMGNPHAVFFVDDLEQIDVNHMGSIIETHPTFPDRTNVEFAQILAPNLIKMRVFERGAGITQACGSGACATLVAAQRHKKADETATLQLDGGELIVTWREDDKHVILRGSATLSFKGVWTSTLQDKQECY